MTIERLEAMTAEQFLDPENLATAMDRIDTGNKRYTEGLQLGNSENCTIYVSIGNVWSASFKRYGNDASAQSYETLGYHTNSCFFWRGVLDSNAAIVIYRLEGEQVKEYKLR